MDFVPVGHATEEQVNAVLECIKSDIGKIPDNTIFRAFTVDSEYVVFRSNIDKYNDCRFQISNENGSLIAQRYYEWEGD